MLTPAAWTLAADAYDMSAGRLGASTAAVLALCGVAAGWLALARPTGRLGTGTGRLGAVTALTAGLFSLALGGLVAVTADGGLGTGNGLGGAYVALLVGLVAAVLGGRALARTRGQKYPSGVRG
ncbi:hypothetical protein C4J65_13590 [Streptomyces sp. CB09001]|uniref:DUF6223 family protein n=1 Tax=unclassified Streptomyces TaxID=2593676 RepID=UPI000E21AFA7|nr:DUF6223 family protein [Streptomyces sp. CB09001]AXL89224.1 hypothetical protein C4J65_13590 [Streptomyces sp. CB09001]